MQTFLPYESFVKTARCLDNKRLGNQCYNEGYQLYLGKWSNHPASKMWVGHEYWLALYLNNLAIEMIRRESFNTAIKWFDFWTNQIKNMTITPKPKWLGDDRLHSSHRAALLFKDPSHYSQFGWKEKPQGPINGKWQYYWPSNK